MCVLFLFISTVILNNDILISTTCIFNCRHYMLSIQINQSWTRYKRSQHHPHKITPKIIVKTIKHIVKVRFKNFFKSLDSVLTDHGIYPCLIICHFALKNTLLARSRVFFSLKIGFQSNLFSKSARKNVTGD